MANIMDKKPLCKKSDCCGFEQCEITATPAIHDPKKWIDIIIECPCGKRFNTFVSTSDMVSL